MYRRDDKIRIICKIFVELIGKVCVYMTINEMISREQIRTKVRELATNISKDYANEDNLLVICVLNGSVFFTTDLVREMSICSEIGFIKATSYVGLNSSGEVTIDYCSNFDINGRNVLIVEDIIDTGRTLKQMCECFMEQNPKSLKICTFLDKKARRVVDITPDYVGYDIEDKFVVGYGMDYNNKLRELDYIGVLSLD